MPADLDSRARALFRVAYGHARYTTSKVAQRDLDNILAALVAVDEAARASEREACAKRCEYYFGGNTFAEIIRARGAK